MAKDRLAIFAVQIVERMRIRASHLKDLLAEDLEVGSKLIPFDNAPGGCGEMLGLEALLRRRQLEIQDERRRTDTECWRDLTLVVRDFINAWEGFSRNEAKNRFLSALPSVPPELKMDPMPPLDHYDQLMPQNDKQEH